MNFDNMTEKEAFHAGFVAYCKEANWDESQILMHIKLANDVSTSDILRELPGVMFGPAGPKGTNWSDTIKKWYNPWGTDTNYGRGEEALMRTGQALMAASAPTAVLGSLALAPGYLMAGLGGLGAAARTVGSAGAGLGTRLGLGSLAPAALLGAGMEGGRRLATAATNPTNIGNSGLALLGLPVAAGAALGGGLGWGAAKMTEPKINEDDIKADEVEQAYRIQGRRLKARRDYEKYRAAKQQ